MPLQLTPPTHQQDGVQRGQDIAAVLDSNRKLVDAISAATAEPKSTVVQRLLAEHRAVGTNVKRALSERKIEQGLPSDALNEFYRTCDASLYEACVWNRFRAKRQMRRWIVEFLKRHDRCESHVLAFGDGPGFDALALAAAGCHVTHFDVSQTCQNFAVQLSEGVNLPVHVLNDSNAIGDRTYDCIVCLDVLEHLEDVDKTIEQFSEWLCPEGLLIVHAPFYLVDAARPTHLRSNTIFSGDTKIFAKHGFQPVAGQSFWNPIVFSKRQHNFQATAKLPVLLGKPLLRLGQRMPTPLGWAANALIQKPSSWIPELASMAATLTTFETLSTQTDRASKNQSTAQIRHFR